MDDEELDVLQRAHLLVESFAVLLERKRKSLASRKATAAQARVNKDSGGGRKAVKHARKYEAAGVKQKVRRTVGISTSERRRRFGHAFANETTFKKANPQKDDRGGALATTPGLRRELSVRRRFQRYDRSGLGSFPVRSSNRASWAGSLRQASARDSGLYGVLAKKAKEVPGLKMHRKHDPTTRLPNVERPVPLGGTDPDRPHGSGGPPPAAGPVVPVEKLRSHRAAARKAKANAKSHTVANAVSEGRVFRFMEAVERARSRS